MSLFITKSLVSFSFVPLPQEGDFHARNSSHEGQDLHLDDNAINLLKVPRLRESYNIGHYNTLGQSLIEKFVLL